ncbi:MAG: tRNA lysidine(34) synthetase TilS [Deltaproteobacteria bacterium]|nr:tRNA lysidine(34) synthetase TilS [Deltaproteobacteria bacterium]
MPTPNAKPISGRLIERVVRTIKDYSMLYSKDSVLACVSGGSDSVALLHILSILSPRFNIKIGIAHLDHSLRVKESEQDAKFVESLALKLGLPFHIKKMHVQKFAEKEKLSVEDAGRKARYNFFLNISEKKGYSRIATAHHAGDNAELILMNMLRGSGKSGLSGIPPVRRKGEKNIIRPLIHLSKNEIHAFLSENGLYYVQDSTNLDTKYLRNRIRHNLIPKMKSSYNSKIVDALNRMGTIIQDEENWIEEIVDREMNGMVFRENDRSIRFSASHFIEKPLPLRRRIVRSLIRQVKGDLKKITYGHIDSTLHLIESSRSEGQVHLPDEILIEVLAGQVLISKTKRIARPPKTKTNSQPAFVFSYNVSKPDLSSETVLIREISKQIRFSCTVITGPVDFNKIESNVAWIDMDKIEFPLTIRNILPGDRFSPLGMEGTQKIKKFFINSKIEKSDRAACPILLSNDRIVWVGGFQIDNSVKVTSSTKKILKVELLLA